MIRKEVKNYLEIQGVSRHDVDGLIHRWTIWGRKDPKPSLADYVADIVHPVGHMTTKEWKAKVLQAVKEVTEYYGRPLRGAGTCPYCEATMEVTP